MMPSPFVQLKIGEPVKYGTLIFSLRLILVGMAKK
jgi:hypothetical protein